MPRYAQQDIKGVSRKHPKEQRTQNISRKDARDKGAKKKRKKYRIEKESACRHCEECAHM
ncbi:MAG: hypothetical protein ACJ749_19775 [Flavisolibacter sp.]